MDKYSPHQIFWQRRNAEIRILRMVSPLRINDQDFLKWRRFGCMPELTSLFHADQMQNEYTLCVRIAAAAALRGGKDSIAWSCCCDILNH